MNQSFLSVNTLLGWRLRTTDGMTAGLRDALLDTESWTIRLLAAEAEGWSPERELLIAPRMVAGYDAARAELNLDADAETLRASPALATEEGIAGFGDEEALPPAWETHWRAERPFAKKARSSGARQRTAVLGAATGDRLAQP